VTADPLAVVLVMAPDAACAGTLARHLVEERLAACVNILPGAVSVYRWQDELRQDPEVLLLCKTRRDLFDALAARVKQLHPYQVPEVILLPLEAVEETYGRWLRAETLKP